MKKDLISPQDQFEQFDSSPNEELKRRYLKKLDRAYAEGGIDAVKELASRTFDDTTIDDLTGLLNRRVFFTLIRKIILPHMNRVKRSAEQRAKSQDVQSESPRSYGSLVVLDLDRFKLINEQFGHAGGDEVLRTFGAMTKEHFREEDVIGRVGGDEIVIIAVELTVSDVKSRMKALQEHFAAHPWDLKPIKLRDEDGALVTTAFSFSYSVVAINDPDQLEELIAKADRKVFERKGRRSK